MILQKQQQLQWLEEMDRRQALTADEKKDLNYRQIGFAGEESLGQILRDLIPSDWLLFQDIRLKMLSGEIQLDAVLFNGLGLTVFEAKNYTADYDYSNGQWKVNGRVKYHNDFQQLDRSVGLLSQELRRNGFNPPIHKYVVYINEDDTVEIDDLTLPFLKRAKIRRFVKQAIKDCQHKPVQSFQREADWLLGQHQSDDRRYSLTGDRSVTLRKGIYCVNCGAFGVEASRFHVTCSHCNYSESKEKAVLRTICAYGVLYPYMDLMASDLMEFIGPDIPYTTVYYTLGKFFIKRLNTTYYINPQSSFDIKFGQIIFKYKDSIKRKDD